MWAWITWRILSKCRLWFSRSGPGRVWDDEFLPNLQVFSIRLVHGLHFEWQASKIHMDLLLGLSSHCTHHGVLAHCGWTSHCATVNDLPSFKPPGYSGWQSARGALSECKMAMRGCTQYMLTGPCTQWPRVCRALPSRDMDVLRKWCTLPSELVRHFLLRFPIAFLSLPPSPFNVPSNTYIKLFFFISSSVSFLFGLLSPATNSSGLQGSHDFRAEFSFLALLVFLFFFQCSQLPFSSQPDFHLLFLHPGLENLGSKTQTGVALLHWDLNL